VAKPAPESILNKTRLSLSIGLSRHAFSESESRVFASEVGGTGHKNAKEKDEDLVDVAQTFG